MTPEMLNIIMQSPVLVAIVTAAGSAIMAHVSPKRGTEDRVRRETERTEDRERISDIHRISRGLDRHINNNEIPFRQQMNDKLDMVTATTQSLLETTKSTNMAISSLNTRVSSIESDVEGIKSDVSELRSHHDAKPHSDTPYGTEETEQ